ncbi:MAG: TonB-dependent receptor, partial [Saprospiraceae bacterium]|nr:TonB-dependent receptor [Saprospiraceae bacterium]
MKKSLLSLFLAAVCTIGFAQRGSVSGMVTDQETKEPLIGANIFVSGATSGTATDNSGKYTLDLPAGNQKLIVSYVGFKTTEQSVMVPAGGNVTLNVELESSGLLGEEVIVSVSRKAEKLTNAPATITVIGAQALSEQPSFNAAELLGRQKGVDYVRSGVLGIGVNARGFNSAFNPKNLQINDGRLSSLIATGLPLGALSTTVKEDIERVEVVLGPSSALYGPNAHNGLLNTITKDPRTSQGTTIALGVGNQSVITGRVRHATKISDKLAFKISAEYTQGEEFDFTDTVYFNYTGFDSPLFGGPGNGSQIIRHAVPELELDRKFNSLRGEAGLYVALNSKSDLIFSGGYSKSNNIGNTNAGRNQIKDWTIGWGQVRYVSPRLFAQLYYTKSGTEDTYAMNQRTQNYLSFKDAGFPEAEALSRSFSEQWFGISPQVGIALKRGAVFKDNSSRINGELQYNNKAGNLFDFIVGVQYQGDKANSDGTYLLDADGAINVGQIGGYLQLERQFGDHFKVVLAGRADNHDLYGFNFIPKAALVYFNNTGSARLTYGKGIAAPTILNLEANIFGGVLLGNGAGFTLSDGSKIEALTVETIETFEIGYKGTLGKKLFFDANAYYNISQNFLSPAINIATNGRTVTHRGDQPMSEVVPGTPETGATLVLTYLNFGEVDTYGADVSLSYSFADGLLGTLNYSWFDFDLNVNDLANDGNRN